MHVNGNRLHFSLHAKPMPKAGWLMPCRMSDATGKGNGFRCRRRVPLPGLMVDPQAANGLRAGPAVYGMWRAGGGACRYAVGWGWKAMAIACIRTMKRSVFLR
ncbi:hypothetical protein Veis_1392 [Verminephrobacter eiseniae EF01-2]|uniref:Uncharacterized protein n=1 Tax=Verminephrobacter eiseniae (strain EF01-2) TaxID=391735 RepID=A1WHP9_VEREI|nr:hypothetical protein Veis_1392 [Verminephrobacter eiseniae EF01-2]